MYSDKKSVQQLVALMMYWRVYDAVVCPGSRNASLVLSMQRAGIRCHAVTDERSAGFVAIGIAQSHDSGKSRVAVCCTSGSALLNLHPAVAEAYYQHVPLVVISADRPAAWIDQLDGQTLSQPGVFGSLVRRSVNLPEVHTPEDEWFCNRMLNEALCEAAFGPVHINVPLGEPIHNMTTQALPQVRVIERHHTVNEFALRELGESRRCMLVVGQRWRLDDGDAQVMLPLARQIAVVSENLGNVGCNADVVTNVDAALAGMSNEMQRRMAPDMLITIGGHVVSKRFKMFLRQHKPRVHWHVSDDVSVPAYADTYGCLTAVFQMRCDEFLRQVAANISVDDKFSRYARKWHEYSNGVPEPDTDTWNQQTAVGKIVKALPGGRTTLHLGNSSAVRMAQLFALPQGVRVRCNRGVNGIEGSLSTAVGHALAGVPDELHVVLIGDLSFFYDMNALRVEPVPASLRIALLNSGGGAIFDTLPGVPHDEVADSLVRAKHSTSVRGWAEERGLRYIKVTNCGEMDEALLAFLSDSDRPIIMEIFI